jgi:hypothetical protein
MRPKSHCGSDAGRFTVPCPMDYLRIRNLNPVSNRRFPLSLLLALALLALAVAGPGSALAKGGHGDRPEVRVAGVCGKGATSKLKLKARDGVIEAEFEVDHNRAGTAWRVVFVQERRVVYRGRARTYGPSGSWSIEERLADLPGSPQRGRRVSRCSATSPAVRVRTANVARAAARKSRAPARRGSARRTSAPGASSRGSSRSAASTLALV